MSVLSLGPSQTLVAYAKNCMIQPAPLSLSGKAAGMGNFMDLNNGPCKCRENIRRQAKLCVIAKFTKWDLLTNKLNYIRTLWLICEEISNCHLEQNKSKVKHEDKLSYFLKNVTYRH